MLNRLVFHLTDQRSNAYSKLKTFGGTLNQGQCLYGKQCFLPKLIFFQHVHLCSYYIKLSI